MGLPEPLHREKICLACREKLCCAHYLVQLTGREVYRIAKALQIAPRNFVRYAEVGEDGQEGFLLAPQGSRHQLVLARQDLAEPGQSTCLFLLRTNDQHGLCGLGPLRPGQCQGFPLYLDHQMVAIQSDPEGCVRRWSYADIHLETERARLLETKAEAAEHRAIVAAWNLGLEAEGRESSFEQFLSYLVNHYAGIGEDKP